MEPAIKSIDDDGVASFLRVDNDFLKLFRHFRRVKENADPFSEALEKRRAARRFSKAALIGTFLSFGLREQLGFNALAEQHGEQVLGLAAR